MIEVPNPAPPRKKNNAWICFFVFVTVASVGVAVFLIWWNLHIQLTPELLEKAEILWQENGPANYNMVYTKRLNDDAKVDKFEVEVRAEQVTKVFMNGKPLSKDEDEDKKMRIHHSMDRLFRDIDRFMDIDQKPNAPKVYVTAIFDDKTGAMLRYIRRVMGSKQRLEIHVAMDALDTETP